MTNKISNVHFSYRGYPTEAEMIELALRDFLNRGRETKRCAEMRGNGIGEAVRSNLVVDLRGVDLVLSTIFPFVFDDLVLNVLL